MPVSSASVKKSSSKLLLSVYLLSVRADALEDDQLGSGLFRLKVFEDFQCLYVIELSLRSVRSSLSREHPLQDLNFASQKWLSVEILTVQS